MQAAESVEARVKYLSVVGGDALASDSVGWGVVYQKNFPSLPVPQDDSHGATVRSRQ